jgi:hypothetical protein
VATRASAGIIGHLFFVSPGAQGAAAALHAGGLMPNGARTKLLWVLAHGNGGAALTIDGRNLTEALAGPAVSCTSLC